MNPVTLLGAGVALALAVIVGTITHELAHAFAMRAFGIPYRIEWLPDKDDAGLLRASISGGWASVRPRRLPDGLSPWALRIAALMPLVLAAPLALAALGIVPDPFQNGALYVRGAAIGWVACALPSPQDFSLVWYAEEAIVRGLPASTPGE